MTRLQGISILIVEDEPLVALDLAAAFKEAGASVTTTTSLKNAIILVEQDDLDGAVVDHIVADGLSDALCERLTERGIPFVVYSGMSIIEGPCSVAPHVAKPETPERLIEMLAGLLGK